MAAAPHRAAVVAEGVLRVAAAAVRAARNLSRPLLQICSTAPVTTGGPPQRGLRTTAVNAAVGQGGARRLGLDLGCELSTVDLRGGRRPAPAKLGHEARILVVHRHKAAGRPAAAAGVEERALGGSVAPSGGVNTLVVLLECAVDLPRLRPHASGSGRGVAYVPTPRFPPLALSHRRELAHLHLLLCDGVIAVPARARGGGDKDSRGQRGRGLLSSSVCDGAASRRSATTPSPAGQPFPRRERTG